MAATSRRGRRPQAASMHSTKDSILSAAQNTFATTGYQNATMREIAAAAGVNAKLVHYYFGTKEDLFARVMSDLFTQGNYLEILLRGSPSAQANSRDSGKKANTPGTMYIHAILTAMEDPSIGPPLLSIVRNLGSHEPSRKLFLRFITESVIKPFTADFPENAAPLRVALIGSQILGLVQGRYIVQAPPLTQASIPQLAHLVGPNIDRYLTPALL